MKEGRIFFRTDVKSIKQITIKSQSQLKKCKEKSTPRKVNKI